MQGDPWIRNECADGTDRGDLRRKAGSISKSGRPEDSRNVIGWRSLMISEAVGL